MDEREVLLSFQGYFGKPSLKIILSTIIQSDQINKARGGRGLKVYSVESYKVKKRDESPYEQFSGTEFANKEEIEIPNIMGNPLYTRQETYAAVQLFVRPEMVPKVNIELNARYPSRIWQEFFPEEGIIDVVLNRNAENLLWLLKPSKRRL